MANKFTKTEVDFEHPAKGVNHCGECKHFEVHGPKLCEIIAGTILPEDWCNKFSKSYRMAKAFKKEKQ